jgi:hypothetical protein
MVGVHVSVNFTAYFTRGDIEARARSGRSFALSWCHGTSGAVLSEDSMFRAKGEYYHSISGNRKQPGGQTAGEAY